MNIPLKMNRDFEKAMAALNERYGEDFEFLNGFHETQLNFSDFIDGFIDKNVADVTIDANANASNKDIRSLLNEKGKSHDKLFAFNKIFYEMKKRYNLRTAKEWLETEYNGGFYLHDASTSTYLPYCYAYDLSRLATEGLFFLKNYNNQAPKHLTTFMDDVIEYRFLDFVSSSKTYKHWMPLFTVMLGTGARIGEILGLRWEDCDFTQNIIDINHNLIYRQQESGKMELHITTPKTRAGTRIIPMFSDVRAALLRIRLKHMEEGFNECEVDGYTNFIFKNRFGEMLNPHVINRALERIIRDCNAEETERAEQEHREPVLLPHFSAHNLRHTFCTRLCENETNLKVIQEIMGHRNIETTMDVYNEATKEKKMSSFANLEGKIRVS